MGSQKTELRWAATLIQKLWDGKWDQWEHHNMMLHEGKVAVSGDELLCINVEIERELQIGPEGLLSQMSFLF